MKHLAKIQTEFLRFADDMSGEVHKEREKRVELSEAPPEIKDVQPTIIKQGMLREVRDDVKDKSIAYSRIRMKQEYGKEPAYSLGVKNLPLQQEAETEISKQMFDCFYPDNLDKPQEKKRYSLSNGWDVDIVDDGGIYAEYEHGKDEDVEVPSHWKVV